MTAGIVVSGQGLGGSFIGRLSVIIANSQTDIGKRRLDLLRRGSQQALPLAIAFRLQLSIDGIGRVFIKAVRIRFNITGRIKG